MLVIVKVSELECSWPCGPKLLNGLYYSRGSPQESVHVALGRNSASNAVAQLKTSACYELWCLPCQWPLAVLLET